MKKRDDDLEERAQQVREEVSELYDFHRHITVAKRLMRNYLPESLLQMTEEDVLELCKPDRCDAVKVLAICKILEQENNKFIQ